MSTIKEEVKAIVESLSEQKVQAVLPLLRYLLGIEEKHKKIPEKEGWKAFMEMGEDNTSGKWSNGSERHDDYLYSRGN